MKHQKVLAIVSEYGYWGIELVGPLRSLESAGYSVDFMTPRGGPAVALPPSKDPTFYDPPLGLCVTTQEAADLVLAFEKEDRLSNPLSLEKLIPERPYVSSPDYLRRLEAYSREIRRVGEETVSTYDAILLVGGSGPMIDMVNNQRLHELVLAFKKADKPIAAICYGVAVLAFARDFNERESILTGKHVTGHCLEYDYHDGTGFLKTDLNIGPPPYVLEYILRDAVGPQGRYHGNFGKETSVVLDWPFLTARSLQCSFEFGDQLVAMLTSGLRRYGW